MIKPLNDTLKVEVNVDEYGFGSKEKEGVETGIVIELPEIMPYFGFHSFAFESSLANSTALSGLIDSYQTLLDKRVWWKEYSERGTVFKEGDGKTYAYVKFTDLIAYGEPKDSAIKAEGKISV